MSHALVSGPVHCTGIRCQANAWSGGDWALGGWLFPSRLSPLHGVHRTHSGSASALLGHLLPWEGVVYRDSHCHLRGHPRGFDGDPQTPVLEGQQCAPWPRWAPACSQEAGRMEEEFLFRMEPWRPGRILLSGQRWVQNCPLRGT